MKKAFLFNLMFLMITQSFGQNQKQISSGKIIFDITYPESKIDERSKSKFPTESIMYFKADKARVDVKMPMGQTTVISDNKTGEGTMLMDMIGKKWAIKMNKNEIQKQKDQVEKPKVEVTSDTKMIAGYKCKKAIVTMKTKEGSRSFDTWFTTELRARNSFTSQIEGIDGFLMEFDNSQNGMSMKMTARSVEPMDVADSEFIVPDGYELKTMDELKGMGGKSK